MRSRPSAGAAVPGAGVTVHDVRVHATAPSGRVRVTAYASCGSSMRTIVSAASTPPMAAESMTTSPYLMAPSAGAGASAVGASAEPRVLPSCCEVSMPWPAFLTCAAVWSTPRYSSSAQLPTRHGTLKPP